MGVFNVHDHLRHRRSRESEETYGEELGWEEEYFEPTEIQAPQQETSQRRQARQRSQKSKMCHYNTKFTARRVKTGSRQMRRHENKINPDWQLLICGKHLSHTLQRETCFLLSLVDHEEIGELDINDLVNNNTSVFASLLTDTEKMKIWNDFVSLSEEEQEVIIGRKTTTTTLPTEVDRGNTEDENVFTQRDAIAIAEKSFNRIEGRIRGTLMNKRFPIGGLKHHEDEVISYFSSDPTAVMVSNVPSSFDRLLVHGVCQFLDLKSTSANHNGERIMEIENNHETFCIPALRLSQYLEQHR